MLLIGQIGVFVTNPGGSPVISAVSEQSHDCVTLLVDEGREVLTRGRRLVLAGCDHLALDTIDDDGEVIVELEWISRHASTIRLAVGQGHSLLPSANGEEHRQPALASPLHSHAQGHDLSVLRRLDRPLVCFLELGREPLLDPLEEMTVLPERREHVSMAQTLLDGQRAGSHVDELRRVGMAQVVRAEVLGQPCCPQRWHDDVLPEEVPVERRPPNADEHVVLGVQGDAPAAPSGGPGARRGARR